MSAARGSEGHPPLLGGKGCLPDTQMFLEPSRNGESTARFRCALTTQAGSASSGAVLNGRKAPTTKRDFLPRRRSIQGPGNIPCGCSRNLSPPPPVLRCSASWKGTPGRPPKASSEKAALSNADTTCSGRPLAPAPRPAPQATERAARSRHSGGRRPRHRAPNSGRTLISPRGTSRWGGGGVRAADASAGRCRGGQGPALPPGADGARRPLARAGPGRCGAHPWGAGRPRDPGWVSRRRAGPGASRNGDTADRPRPAPPPPHTPHTDPDPAGGAARGPLPGRRGRGTRGRWSPAPECGPPGRGRRGGGARPGRWRGRQDRARSRSKGAGPPRGDGEGTPASPSWGGGRVGAAPGENRRGAAARARAGGAGRTWGEGGRARDGFPGSHSAGSAAKAGKGAAGPSSHSPRGGKRRRRSRSPCSGWVGGGRRPG